MPASNPELTLTRIAAGVIVANRAVTFANLQAAAAGVKVLGVSVFDAQIGEAVAVVVTGTAIIEAGAAIANGDDLVTDDQGRAIPATGAPGERVFSDAMGIATGAGKLVEVLLKR